MNWSFIVLLIVMIGSGTWLLDQEIERERIRLTDDTVRLIGPATARDGDSLMFGPPEAPRRVQVRLADMDAPEADQPGGTEATAVLAVRLINQIVECEILGRGRYGRPIGRCRVGELDLGAQMVRSGWAAIHPAAPPTYAAELAHARAHLLGLWGTDYARGGWRCTETDDSECPWTFRRRMRAIDDLSYLPDHQSQPYHR